MTVLILTDSLDIHGDAARWALANWGAECLLWCLDQFPGSQTLSSRLRPDHRDAIEISLDKHSLIADFNSIWIRRLPDPQSVPPELNPADAPMALHEASKIANGLRPLIGKNPVWINPIETRLLSSLKPVQLVAARKVGLRIPDTLFSNDPADIRAFHREHDGNIVYKPFNQAYWHNGATGRISGIFASKVPKDLLQDDVVLSSCPGIYQRYVEKHSELRVTFFGRSYVAARIHSQKTAKAAVDWRSDMKGEAPMERAYLPPHVYDKCVALMHELNIVHGSFDLIQTTEDDFVFLEVNEMGQFVWLEERLPEIPAMRMFISFALSPSASFEYRDAGTLPDVSFASYLSSPSYQVFRQRLIDRRKNGSPYRIFNYAE